MSLIRSVISLCFIKYNETQSHTKLLPPLKGKTVIPSGRDPSPLSNPGGSRTDGRPAFWSALLTTSFIAECLGKRPALYLQDKPCKPLLSILPPQRQEWGIQTSAPTLRAMATLKLSESRNVPSDETGKALSQVPLSLSVPWPAIWLCTPGLPHATCFPNSSQQ